MTQGTVWGQGVCERKILKERIREPQMKEKLRRRRPGICKIWEMSLCLKIKMWRDLL